MEKRNIVLLISISCVMKIVFIAHPIAGNVERNLADR